MTNFEISLEHASTKTSPTWTLYCFFNGLFTRRVQMMRKALLEVLGCNYIIPEETIYLQLKVSFSFIYKKLNI